MMKKRALPVLMVLAVLFMTAISASAAVDRVLCVPWEGNPAMSHTAISDQAVKVMAVIYGDATGGTVTYSWDFLDGTAPTTGTIAVPANGIYNLEVLHTFAGESVGSTFPTVLTIDGKTDIYNIIIATDTNDSRVNIAIDKGLWYLHKQMYRTNVGAPSVPGGYWDDNGYLVGSTGAAVWAFEVQGHLLPVESNPLRPLEDPYVETVQRGINYLLSRTFNQAMNLQTHGWPEDYDGDNANNDGNGYGLVCYYDSGHTNYELGIAMGAIAGSGAPNAKATTAYNATYAPYVVGRTYKEIVQDMVDWYAWSQNDSTVFPRSGPRGGWYYTAYNNAAGGADSGDNSAAQWAYIGLDAAESNFGCIVPTWVKTQLAGYLHPQISYQNRGFVGYRANSGDTNVCLTGGALVGMALVGESIYDTQNGSGSYASDLALIKNFMGINWKNNYDRLENWFGYRAYYTMYAVMKGLRLHGITSLPGSPGTSDWYNDYVGVMLPYPPSSPPPQSQYEDGHWRGAGWIDGYIQHEMGTAFGVLILTPSVFSPPPVACFIAGPNPGYLDIPITLDPSCSYHTDAMKNIVKYEWDFNSDGVYDVTTVTPDPQVHVWDDATYDLGSFPVTLRVTDDTLPTPVTDTFTVTVNLTLPPHPPTADAGGPYMVSLCAGDSLTLDGSGSYDIDEGQSETGSAPFDTITSYKWDINGAPWVYDVPAGPGSSPNVTVTSGYGVNPDGSARTVQIGLQVTDNTLLAYPGSQQPNLTNEDFTSLTVYPGCACNLAARVKSGKVSLTWTHTGAANYDIYRSTTGPNSGFTLIKDNHVTTYATYLDAAVTNGVKYWYRVVSSDGCGSKAVSAIPTTR
jgi:hypothetical protein